MRWGLVLGGGGVVGIAWEIGVLAGLKRSGVVDPASADVIVGTSAGSVVGARVALGHDVAAMFEEQQQPQAASPSSPTGDSSGAARPRPDMSAVMEIFGELRKAERVTPEVARVVGQKAMAAATPPEDRWIASFDASLGAGAGWPEADLRIAALNCMTGERRMWTSADAGAVPLGTAVASSCAVPGMFPTVQIGEARYTDGGVWSGSNADVVVGDGLDAVVFIGPTAGGPQPPGRRAAIDMEAEQLTADGARFAKVIPGPAFATEVGMNLMDPAFRARGAAIGIDDGVNAAAEIRRVLTGD